MDTTRRQALIATARSKISTRQRGEEHDRFGNNSALSMQKDSTSPLSNYGDQSKASNTKEMNKIEESTLIKSAINTKEDKKEGIERSSSNWFGKKAKAGAGLLYKFTNFENKLIRWILEK